MSNKKTKQQPDELQHVEEALSKSEAFIENNLNTILVVVGVIVVIFLSFIGVKNFYIQPKNEEAAVKMAFCVENFERDSFNLALNGDVTNDGFIDIIENYGITQSADLASYYAGVCAYKLNDFDAAIDYLKKADLTSINYAPVSLGLIGDCYVAKDDLKTAIDYFNKASEYNNEMTAPIYLKKAGLAYEKLGNNGKAVQCYQTIKDDFAKSQAANDIDKYIVRAQTK